MIDALVDWIIFGGLGALALLVFLALLMTAVVIWDVVREMLRGEE